MPGERLAAGALGRPFAGGAAPSFATGRPASAGRAEVGCGVAVAAPGGDCAVPAAGDGKDDVVVVVVVVLAPAGADLALAMAASTEGIVAPGVATGTPAGVAVVVVVVVAGVAAAKGGGVALTGITAAEGTAAVGVTGRTAPGGVVALPPAAALLASAEGAAARSKLVASTAE